MNDIDILENYVREWHETDVAVAIENLISRVKDLETIEQIHREDNGKLREEIKDFAEIDLTQTYLSGIYAERDRWKNKIKEKIEECKKEIDKSTNVAQSAEYEYRIELYEELLQEER